MNVEPPADATYRVLTLVRHGGVFVPTGGRSGKPTGDTTMAKAKRPATKKTNATKAGAIVKASKAKGGGKAK